MYSDKPIQTVAVIGAGVMGAGIAAQAANGGARVILLDIPAPDTTAHTDETPRNAIAANALARMLKAGSAGALMDPAIADRIQVGNTEDDLPLLADADWIVEAVVERIDIKQDLYRRIDAVRAPDAIVSSNTSTLPLAALMEGMSQGLREHFVVTHFFNPPRHMRLLELVTGQETLSCVAPRIERFLDHCMGKTVIRCNDRPGFIANRLGVYWMQVALQEAVAFGLSVEDADAIMQVCGFPKTGVFGLWDLVGIDLMPQVSDSLSSLLPADDPFQAYSAPVPLIAQMIRNGWFGRKGRVLQGFYRQYSDDTGRKVREVLDLQRLEYRAPASSELPSAQLPTGQIAALISAPDTGGQYAWRVLSRVLDYATQLVPEVAEEISAVDAAMRLGYNWCFGPFELIDMIGTEAFTSRMMKDGSSCSRFLQQAAGQSCYGEAVQLNEQGEYQTHTSPAGVIDWQQITRQPPLQSFNRSLLRSLDSDTLCLEFTHRINALSTQLLDEIESALTYAIRNDKALILYSDTGIFAAGADLREFALMATQDGAIDRYIRRGQALFAAIRQAPVPVVAAVAGKALGGGLELLFHCHHIQAHAESALGLVETRVGIVPGWGGCRELLARQYAQVGAHEAVARTFALIANARVSGSALEAKRWGLLRDCDAISMNRDRLLSDAMAQARRLRDPAQYPRADDLPPLQAAAPEITAPQGSYQSLLEQRLLQLLNTASEPGWYDQFSDQERRCNLELLQYPAALQRIRSLLDTGTPITN